MSGVRAVAVRSDACARKKVKTQRAEEGGLRNGRSNASGRRFVGRTSSAEKESCGDKGSRPGRGVRKRRVLGMQSCEEESGQAGSGNGEEASGGEWRRVGDSGGETARRGERGRESGGKQRERSREWAIAVDCESERMD